MLDLGEGHSVLHCCSFDEQGFSGVPKKSFRHGRAWKRQWGPDTPQAISQGFSCWQHWVLTFFVASSCMQCQRVSWATWYQWHLRDQLGGSCFKNSGSSNCYSYIHKQISSIIWKIPDAVRVNVIVKDSYTNEYLKSNRNSPWEWKSWYKKIKLELNAKTEQRRNMLQNHFVMYKTMIKNAPLKMVWIITCDKSS